MKQLETHSVTVGDVTFYIRPFSAFKASNIFGKVSAVLLPLLSGLLPMAVGMADGKEGSVFDMELSDLASSLSESFGSLSGDKLEDLLKELLIRSKNISYDDEESGKTVMLSEDAANELFCGDMQGMLMLAWEVLKLNYSGFFRNLSGLSGTAIAEMQKKAQLNMKNTVY